MSFLPDFEDDIFISYAHIDNKALTEGQKGWISHFHEALEIRLAHFSARRPRFGEIRSCAAMTSSLTNLSDISR